MKVTLEHLFLEIMEIVKMFKLDKLVIKSDLYFYLTIHWHMCITRMPYQAQR